MKNLTNYVSYVPRSFVLFMSISVLAFSAIIAPISTQAAQDVEIEGSIGVANQTQNESAYEQSTNASFDDEVIFQIYYHNQEDEDSGKIAENLSVKTDFPNQEGKEQKVTATIGGDNTNTITSTSTVNLDREDAKLQFMPGTVVWKHNDGTNDDPNMVTEKLSDSVVTSGEKVKIEDAQPCFNFDATITFKARVVTSAVDVTKYVRTEGEEDWSRKNSAEPGDTLEYAISYKNTGNTQHDNVIVRDSLPPKLDYVEGSTMLKNAKTDGEYTDVSSDNVTNGGIDIGSYTPGSNAFVKFKAKIPAKQDLKSGTTDFRNVGVVQPEGMNEFYNTTSTKVHVEREPEPEEKMARCVDLAASVNKGQPGVTVDFEAEFTSKNLDVQGFTIDYGDGSTEQVTGTTASHTYEEAGEFDARVTKVVTNEGTKDAGNDCAVTITVEKPEDREELPVTGPANGNGPDELPNTGIGSTLAMLFGSGALGVGVRSWFASRRNLMGSLLGN